MMSSAHPSDHENKLASHPELLSSQPLHSNHHTPCKQCVASHILCEFGSCAIFHFVHNRLCVVLLQIHNIITVFNSQNDKHEIPIINYW